MKCAEVRKMLPELALGDLDAEPAFRAEGHLQECAACRSEFETIGRAAEALRGATPLAPSAERRDRAVEAMVRASSGHPPVRTVRRAWRRWAGAAAAAALVPLAAFWTLGR
ncbi:MAG: anti-sigma factor family protein, partial [Planctomycetota bacterium]